MSNSGQIEKPHILVVDDEEGIRYMLETKLSSAGYRVTVAATALHAIQKIRSGKVVDLIICDLKMPGQAGTELFKAAKDLAPDVPFILITGYPEKGKIMDALRSGIKDVMLKPVRHSELLAKVIAYVGEGIVEAEKAA